MASTSNPDAVNGAQGKSKMSHQGRHLTAKSFVCLNLQDASEDTLAVLGWSHTVLLKGIWHQGWKIHRTSSRRCFNADLLSAGSFDHAQHLSLEVGNKNLFAI